MRGRFRGIAVVGNSQWEQVALAIPFLQPLKCKLLNLLEPALFLYRHPAFPAETAALRLTWGQEFPFRRTTRKIRAMLSECRALGLSVQDFADGLRILMGESFLVLQTLRYFEPDCFHLVTGVQTPAECEIMRRLGLKLLYWQTYPPKSRWEEGFCVDEQTEILTKTGWKTHAELKIGDIALTVNMQTLQSEWQPVNSIHRFLLEDSDMFQVETQEHSSLTTLNHRWPVKMSHTSKRMKVPAGAFENQIHPCYRFRESQNLNNGDRLIKIVDHAEMPEKPHYSDAFVELVAWFITEGHIRKNVKSGTLSTQVEIVQSLRINPQYVARIEDCLRSLYGPPSMIKSRHTRAPEPAWKSRMRETDQLYYFNLNSTAGKPLCLVAPNRIPSFDFILRLTRHQLHLFIQTCVDGDGFRTATHEGKSIRIAFIQKRDSVLDAFRFACTLAGFHTQICEGPAGCKTVTISKTRMTKAHLAGRVIKYTGVTWCPTTQNSTWFARRKNKYYFTGNTFQRILFDAQLRDPKGVTAAAVVSALKLLAGDELGFHKPTQETAIADLEPMEPSGLFIPPSVRENLDGLGMPPASIEPPPNGKSRIVVPGSLP